MSTTNSACKPVIPNGIKIPTTSVKPFSDGGNPTQISFLNKRPNTPLPPLVQSFYNGENLQVCAVVFINVEANIDPRNINVYWDEDVLCPNFYISYDAAEAASSIFNAYQVNFNITLKNQPSTINTVVWDEDPIGSRGTITTVQP
jgi:hypothetical protein